MAQIWIQGKPVVVDDAGELLRLIAYADKAAPASASEATPPPPQPIAEAPQPSTPNRPAVVRTTEPQRREPLRAVLSQRAAQLSGVYAFFDGKPKRALQVLASAHPLMVDAEVLRSKLGLEVGERALAGVMMTITKRVGKGVAVETIIKRKARGKREYAYKLTNAMMAVANAEGWAKGGAEMTA